MPEKQSPQSENSSSRERIKSMWLHSLASSRFDRKLPSVDGDWKELEFEFLSFSGKCYQFLDLAHGGNLDDWFSEMFWTKEMPSYDSKSIYVYSHNISELSKAIDLAYAMRGSILSQLQHESIGLPVFFSTTKDLFYKSSKHPRPPSEYIYPECRSVLESENLKSEIQIWFQSIQIISIMNTWLKSYVAVDFDIDRTSNLDVERQVLIDGIYQLIEQPSMAHKQPTPEDMILDPIKKRKGYNSIVFKGELLDSFSNVQANVIRILHERYLKPNTNNELKFNQIIDKTNITYRSMKKLARNNKDFFKVVKRARRGYWTLNIE